MIFSFPRRQHSRGQQVKIFAFLGQKTERWLAWSQKPLAIFAVVIVGWRDAAQAEIDCSFKAGVLHARATAILLESG
jgi:hypothetical protein